MLSRRQFFAFLAAVPVLAPLLIAEKKPAGKIWYDSHNVYRDYWISREGGWKQEYKFPYEPERADA